MGRRLIACGRHCCHTGLCTPQEYHLENLARRGGIGSLRLKRSGVGIEGVCKFLRQGYDEPACDMDCHRMLILTTSIAVFV